MGGCYSGQRHSRRRDTDVGSSTTIASVLKHSVTSILAEQQSAAELDPQATHLGSVLASTNLMGMPSSTTPFYILRKTKSVSSKYDIAEQLGSGQFGVVSVAIDRSTGKRFAIKSMSKRRAGAPNSMFKDIRTEVEVMYLLGGHNNVVQLHDVYEDDDMIHLIQELCEGGDWFQRLVAKGTYSERQAAETSRTLLQTLAYCHSLGVVHRDIKPENFLYTDHTDNASVKFSDFGLSALVPKTALEPANTKAGRSSLLLHDAVGSTYYVAPEVLKSRGYGKECDIWSLGVVIFIVLGGYPPFDGTSEQKVFESILYHPLRFDDPTWQSISDNAKDFIARILCKDPSRRASVSELLAHPWLAMSSDPGQPQPKASDAPVPDAVVTRLQQFAGMSRFKKQARKVLATFLPEEEVVGLMSIFREMDTDGNGVLTLDELCAALKSKGIDLPIHQTRNLLRCTDLNGDGVIDYEEFLAATVHHLRLEKDELMYKAFKHFDRDRSGFISKQELRAALDYQGGGQGGLDVDSILHDVDSDHDGRINYEEFCNCVRVRESHVTSPLAQLVSASFKARSQGKVTLNCGGPKLGLLVNSGGSRPVVNRLLQKCGSNVSNVSNLSRHSRNTEPGGPSNRVKFKDSPDEVFRLNATMPSTNPTSSRTQSEYNGRRSNRGITSRLDDGFFRVLLQSSRQLTGTGASERRRNRPGLQSLASRLTASRSARRSQPSSHSQEQTQVRVKLPVPRTGRPRSGNRPRSRSGSRSASRGRPTRAARPSNGSYGVGFVEREVLVRDASYGRMQRPDPRSSYGGTASPPTVSPTRRINHPHCIASRNNSQSSAAGSTHSHQLRSQSGSSSVACCSRNHSAGSLSRLSQSSAMSVTGRSPSKLLPAVSRSLYQKALDQAGLQSVQSSFRESRQPSFRESRKPSFRECGD